MRNENQARQYLIEQIDAKRRSLNAFIRKLQPRSARLTNQGIVFSALAAALTAGPGLGGEKFTEFAKQLLGSQGDSPIWRLLCFAAMVCSLIASISTSLYKTHQMDLQLAKAQDVHSKLEGLALSVHMGLDMMKATELFTQYNNEAAFVPAAEPVSTS